MFSGPEHVRLEKISQGVKSNVGSFVSSQLIRQESSIILYHEWGDGDARDLLSR